MLSLLIFLFPALYGEGYLSINLLLNGDGTTDWNRVLDNSLFAGEGNLLLVYIALVILTKVIATSATNGAGGCGGTFAPSLFVGCFAGFFFSHFWNQYQLGTWLPEKNFALMGMAGVMSGGIFLIAELTGGYGLFLPLMIVSVTSYLVIILFEPHSIYGARLAREGKLITHNTDHAVLTLMQLDSVINKDYMAVGPDVELGDVVRKISRSHTNVIPVLDAAGGLLGEIDIASIRHIVFRIELYHHFVASQLMKEPKAVLSDSDSMAVMMETFDRTQADWLPVHSVQRIGTPEGNLRETVDEASSKGNRFPGLVKGYVSRQRMFAHYRQMVADLSED